MSTRHGRHRIGRRPGLLVFPRLLVSCTTSDITGLPVEFQGAGGCGGCTLETPNWTPKSGTTRVNALEL